MQDIVAYVGQETITIARVSASGAVDLGSLRRWTRDQARTVSDAFIAFKQEAGLRHGEVAAAIAVAGPVHGHTVTITHGQWHVAADGLAAILGRPPIILNDVEACAWAILHDLPALEQLAGPAIAVDPARARRFCVVGIDAGLGVAACGRTDAGEQWVLSSEAGDATFPAVTDTTRALVAHVTGGRRRCPSDLIVSRAGFEAIRRWPAAPADRHLSICAQATLELCADLALTFGAWDGIILTGREPERLRAALAQQYAAGAMAPEGAHIRKLRMIPLAYAGWVDSPLAGAALRLMRR